MRTLIVTDSSNIRKLAYDANRKELLIWFASARRQECYSYQNVPADVWITLITADSVGKAFHAVLRGYSELYPYAKHYRRPQHRDERGRFIV